jgi:LmbE family N-acetylglucosaminyl deacetylase
MQAPLPTGPLSGPLLVLAPHFDDEILGCGSLLEGVADKGRIQVVFACDGRGSADLKKPAPAPGAPDVGAVRAAESLAALALLALPPAAVRRLDFPDGSLPRRKAELGAALERIVEEVNPRWILAPFRFDRHPDHIALARAALALPAVREGRAQLLEYFVYTRFRLFPGRDIRRVVRPDYLLTLEAQSGTFLKRRALDCFTTQVTRYFPWQERPVLSEAFLREVAAAPEQFLAAPRGASDATVMRWPPWLVSLILAVESQAKRAAYRWRLKRRLNGRKNDA